MILDFSDELGKRHFEFCFVGFILGGAIQQQKGMNILRTEVSIFEKLEAVSEVKPCGKKLPTGEQDRQLKTDGALKIHIDHTEFDLLYNYMAQVPWQAGTPGKNALEAITWLLGESKR